MAKIHILGGAGSGKSTLARRLATQLQVPHYDLDVLGRKNGTNAAAHIADQMRIANQPGWVVEGVYVVLVDPLLHAADTIVLLNVAWPVALWRIVQRHVVNTLRGTNEYPSLELLWRLLRDSFGYYTNQRNERAGLMYESIAAQHSLPVPPTTVAMIQHLETFHPVSIPPTAAYVRSYLEKYREKVVVVKTQADYNQLVARFSGTPPLRRHVDQHYK